MKRRLFNLAAGMSLALLLAVLVLWGVSHRRAIYVGREARPDAGSPRLDDPMDLHVVGFEGGRLVVLTQAAAPIPQPSACWEFRVREPDRYSVWHYGSGVESDWGDWALLGVEYAADVVGYPRTQDIAVPCSYLALLLSLAPAVWLVSRRKRRARLRNPAACGGCGYDLTGNVSAVCPECGTAITGEPIRES